MGFSIIVAVDAQRGIGMENRLPWRLKGDMRWFVEATTTKDPARPNSVIMGRKTWESIPEKFRPLSNRENIVITRRPEHIQAPHKVSGFEAALALAKTFGGDIFVIGGASIYAEAYHHPELERLFVTEIKETFDCDTFFPDYGDFREDRELARGEENGLKYRIVQYVK